MGSNVASDKRQYAMVGKNIVVEGVIDISELLEQEKSRKEEVQEDVKELFQYMIKDQ